MMVVKSKISCQVIKLTISFKSGIVEYNEIVKMTLS
jgi:hypothetical protein